MAKLQQDQIRELVGSYFHAQLAQYIESYNNRGFTDNMLEDMRCANAEFHGEPFMSAQKRAFGVENEIPRTFDYLPTRLNEPITIDDLAS